MKMILETKRLLLRELCEKDYASLCSILQDDEVMVAYEGAFDDDMVKEWFDRQLHRYQENGFGLWAVVLKETNEMIGQCGITLQEVSGKHVKEVGYLFQKAYWHQGYAWEASKACIRYAFEHLHTDCVYSIVRDSNIASKKVAMRNQMKCVGQITKYYRGVTMPHEVYCIERVDSHA